MKEIKSIYNNLIVIVAVVVMLMCNYVCSTPMMYKRNPDDKFERDLVPVSSTVIPLTALEVSYGLGGKPSEEYKEAYLKKLRKKVQREHEKGASDKQIDPDTLITVKKKHNDASNKAKVKGIIITNKNPSETAAANN
ncbi:uncharacterized protein LOC106087643 [Stomoxys calcitrans]|uniref:uncharacterized protein LOC106087643 n=1 Tax=Stomoxys calcitrans TaxID=35570 RepID=UPI0027E21BCC|nr:uncharacterized protein LOC106087643 [Stomoxys calcitrans]